MKKATGGVRAAPGRKGCICIGSAPSGERPAVSPKKKKRRRTRPKLAKAYDLIVDRPPGGKGGRACRGGGEKERQRGQ